MKPLHALLGIVIIVTPVAAWLLRWQVTVSTNQYPFVFVLDRWTGNLYSGVGGSGSTLSLMRKAEPTKAEPTPTQPYTSSDPALRELRSEKPPALPGKK